MQNVCGLRTPGGQEVVLAGKPGERFALLRPSETHETASGGSPGSDWGSRGRRFKSCQPDYETAGQSRCVEHRLSSYAADVCRGCMQRMYAGRTVGPRG